MSFIKAPSYRSSYHYKSSFCGQRLAANPVNCANYSCHYDSGLAGPERILFSRSLCGKFYCLGISGGGRGSRPGWSPLSPKSIARWSRGLLPRCNLKLSRQPWANIPEIEERGDIARYLHFTRNTKLIKVYLSERLNCPKFTIFNQNHLSMESLFAFQFRNESDSCYAGNLR